MNNLLFIKYLTCKCKVFRILISKSRSRYVYFLNFYHQFMREYEFFFKEIILNGNVQYP